MVVPALPAIADPCVEVSITIPDGWKTDEKVAGVVG